MLAEQQPFDADVFVEVGPMYSIASPAYLKLSAFRAFAIRETGITIRLEGKQNGPSSISIDSASSVTSTFKTVASVTNPILLMAI